MVFRKSNGEVHLSLLEAYKDNVKDVISSMVNKIKKGSSETCNQHKYDNYGDYDDLMDDCDDANDDDDVEIIINEEDNENGT